MALINKRVVGSKGFRGMSVELIGLQDVINQISEYGKVATKAFNEAAAAFGKMMSKSMKEELAKRLAEGRKSTISLREVSEKARDQIAWGGIKTKERINWRKPTPEQSEWYAKWAEEKMKSGKPIRRKPKNMPKSVPIANFVTKTSAVVYGKTGSLMKSIGYKKWSPPAKKTMVQAPSGRFTTKYISTGKVYCYVGARSVVTAAYNEKAREMQKVDTIRYYSLVEFGHKMVVMGRQTGLRVPPRPYMSAAYKRTGPAASRVARGIIMRHLAKASLDVRIRKPSGLAA